MYNNLIDRSRNFGKIRPITNGINWDYIQSGFTIADEYVPNVEDGHFPAGMLLICNEEDHTALPFVCAKVLVVDGTTISIPLNDGYCLAPFVVGESIMALGDDFETSGTAAKIVSIETSEDGKYTNIIVDTALTLTTSDYIIACNEDGSQFGSPNAMLPVDAYKETGSYVFMVPAVRQVDGDVYENRIPAIPEIAKTSLRHAGCRFGFSKSL